MTDKNDRNGGDNGDGRGFFAALRRCARTLGAWIRRSLFGASRELSEISGAMAESLESPARITVRSFLRHRLAVVALATLAAIFLFVFVGSLLFPINLG